MTTTKRWYQSRMIRFNIATGMVMIGGEFLAITDTLPPEWQALARMTLSAVIAVGNVILRFDTETAIA